MDQVSDDVGPRGEERVGVGGGGLDVGGVEAVGELEEEAVGGAEQGVGGGGCERGHDRRDLERGGAVLPGDSLVRVHRLQQAQQDPRRYRRHGLLSVRRSGGEGGEGFVDTSRRDLWAEGERKGGI